MDSGLGSDEEQRRSRTKEQKQRLNEQLLNGANCFIDASALQDEEDGISERNDEKRRIEERRQGALLFQSAIPQYSTMLQLAAGPSSLPPDTPFNSIVHIEQEVYTSETFEEKDDEEEGGASKQSLGFYVDLSQVEVETTKVETSSSTTKNIFSMVIDFEAPKKDMPTRLFKNANRRKQSQASKAEDNDLSSLESRNDSLITTNNTHHEETASKEEVQETQFVRLSDLENTKKEVEVVNDYIAPRMSKSIPESSWVESPLLMSRSAGYRVAPRPLEADTNSLSDSTGSQTGVSQRRLGTDLLRMFLEELDTDTTLHVGSKKIKAHRCILISRCQYFAGSLRGHSLVIDGFTYEAVHFALCHIYSGAAHVPDSISLVELASLADMLSLEGLKEVVAHALKSRHCHQFHSPCAGCLTGVLEVLPLSAAYGLDELYQRCLKWITSNYLRVWPSRAFASLPKELREKCLQQHVVHMCPTTVLETNLSCDRLLVSLPSAKWAESVVQLGLQLAHTCKTFITQNFVAILPTVLKIEPWDIPRIEEILLNSTTGLTIDQQCCVCSRCYGMLKKHKDDISTPLRELLEKLQSQMEKNLVAKANKLSKCPSWNKMDPNLKLQIKSLGKIEEPGKPRKEPSKLPRMITNKPGTSSSESSRNSSPATSQSHPSPSLRRSLLLAARAPQVQPSPLTVRRISTLTLPTAASAAKSTPARQNKSQSMSSSTTSLKNRPISAPVTKRPVAIKASQTNPVNKKESDRVARNKLNENVNKKQLTETTVKKQSNVKKFTRTLNSTVSRTAHTPTSRTTSTKNKNVEPDKTSTTFSPCMQRSSTFLKEEPTVLTHPSKVQT